MTFADWWAGTHGPRPSTHSLAHTSPPGNNRWTSTSAFIHRRDTKRHWLSCSSCQWRRSTHHCDVTT